MKTKILYNIKDDTYHIISEIKRERIQEVIETLLHSQIGAGEDDSEPKEKDTYTYGSLRRYL